MKTSTKPTATPETGFTLVELLTVLAVAGVLLATAAPSYQQLIERQQLRAAVADLVAAIDLARAQAIARGRIVMLAPLDPGGIDWRGGWIVFVDANDNRRPDADETTIFQRGPLPAGLRMSVSFTSKAPPSYLAYNSAGRTCNAGNGLAARWGTLSLALGAHARNIKINMLGRLRVCDPAAEAACTGASE
ncbi:type-4 fimbrial pilin related signal peptide protein [Duganella sp. Leaf126]|nr:type-4 fimbrial pilin related signal peptide protein [Duganella sp. Leaf126]